MFVARVGSCIPACCCPLCLLFPTVCCSALFVVPHHCWSFPTLIIPQSLLFPAVGHSLLLVVPCYWLFLSLGCSLPFSIPTCCWSFPFPIIGCPHSQLLVVPISHRWLSPFHIIGCSLCLSFPPGHCLLLMGLVPAIHCSLFFIIPCHWSSSHNTRT